MNRVIQLVNIRPDVRFKNSHRGRVYSMYGIAPTIFNYAGGGNLTAKMVEWTDEPDKGLMFLNGAKGGVSRTLKSNYWKSSIANFVHKDGHGATGVIEYDF